MLTEKTKTIAVNILAIGLIAVLLIWGETYRRQLTQFRKGEAAWAVRDFPGAVAGYESAIHMYTPGSSMVYTSARRLWEIGELSEGAGDIPRALVVYRALRSSFYAIHCLATPGTDWIARCDVRIARLIEIQAGKH